LISKKAQNVRAGLRHGSINQDYQRTRLDWENAAKKVPTPAGVEGLWHVWPAFGDFPEANEATERIAKHISKYRVRVE